MRQFSFAQNLIVEFDKAIRTCFLPANTSSTRPIPGDNLKTNQLSSTEKKQVASLMRVNHSGEIAAQALYQGQALTARLDEIKVQMNEAALEEVEHLKWCEARLTELQSNTSKLNPIWYTGSFLIGALAGAIGDKWSLGFVVETERQVSAHLEKHLKLIPQKDIKTRAILLQMHEDETKHMQTALNAGGANLPPIIKKLMNMTSKIMTQLSYHI